MMGRAHNQSGFTLIELLVVLAVSGLIAIPLFSWVLLSLRADEGARNRSTESTAANVLTRSLSNDLATSSGVTVTGTDCTGGTRTGGVLVLAIAGSTGGSAWVANYTAVGSGSAATLVRRQCPTAGGTLTSESILAPDLATPVAGWASIVTCRGRTGRTGDTCGRVAITLPFATGHTATIEAARRIGGPL